MTGKERFREVDEVFREARRLSGSARRAFLEDRCKADESLRGEVEELLEEDDLTRGALDEPAINEAIRLSGLGVRDDLPPVEPIPERIGRYRILARIGAGGMGTVYEAEQDHPRRMVAVKVINQGLVSHATLRRFEHEAQVLARLEHPCIARIYDAGVHDFPQGRRPYFAMELVRGEPVRDYAERRSLRARARLELFASICDGVQHAHQRGVVHRDLKPANILVDEEGHPRILDFGVARAVDDDAQVTSRTDAGQIIGTLAYMSPEQASGNPDDVDTRSDVYALGVLGYELLTGSPPYELRGKSIPDALRVVCDQEPAPISSIDKSLRGDVQTIFAKALEKDKTRRYCSSSALADDVRRFLSDEPIAARPPSTMYQLAKFSARNRALVSLVAAAIVLLAAAAAVATFFAVGQARARTQADGQTVEATRQAEIATAVSEFLNEDVLSSADPAVHQGRDITVREAIATSESHIAERFGDKPLTEAGVRMAVGKARLGMGDLLEAEQHFRRACELRTNALGEGAQPTLLATEMLAHTLYRQGKYEDSIAMRRRALELAERSIGLDHRTAIYLASGLGDTIGYTGRFDEAVAVLRPLLERIQRVHGEDDIEATITMNNLGAAIYGTGDFREALRIQEEVVRRFHSSVGETHPFYSDSLVNLSGRQWRAGDLDAALRTADQALELRNRVLGPEHDSTLTARATRARILDSMGDLKGAEPELRECLGLQVQKLGSRHRISMLTAMVLASCLIKQERFEEAFAVVQPVREIIDVERPKDPGKRGMARALTGVCLAALGERDRATLELREAETLLAKAPLEPDELRKAVRDWLARLDQPGTGGQFDMQGGAGGGQSEK